MKEESSDQSSSNNTSSVNPLTNKTIEDIKHMFQSRVRFNDDRQILMTKTVCKAKGSVEGNVKGRGQCD